MKRRGPLGSKAHKVWTNHWNSRRAALVDAKNNGYLKIVALVAGKGNFFN